MPLRATPLDWIRAKLLPAPAPCIFARANHNRLRVAYLGWECTDPVLQGHVAWFTVEMLTVAPDSQRADASLTLSWEPSRLRIASVADLPLASQSDHQISFEPGRWAGPAASRLVFFVDQTGPTVLRWEMSRGHARQSRTDKVFIARSGSAGVERPADPRITVTTLDDVRVRSDIRAGLMTGSREVARGDCFWQAADEPASQGAIRELSASEVT